jgi:hypothetical protein
VQFEIRTIPVVTSTHIFSPLVRKRLLARLQEANSLQEGCRAEAYPSNEQEHNFPVVRARAVPIACGQSAIADPRPDPATDISTEAFAVRILGAFGLILRPQSEVAFGGSAAIRALCSLCAATRVYCAARNPTGRSLEQHIARLRGPITASAKRSSLASR